MNKETAVEVMATFLHNENVAKALPRIGDDEERIEKIKSERMKDSFRVTSSSLYDVMDEQGLIVKD